YTWFLKPTFIALYMMTCWGGKVTVQSYKKTCAFIKMVIPQSFCSININGNIIGNNSSINIGSTQIINGVRSKGKLNIVQDGQGGNNYQEVSNVNASGDIHIRQTNRGGNNTSIIRNCTNTDGSINIIQDGSSH